MIAGHKSYNTTGRFVVGCYHDVADEARFRSYSRRQSTLVDPRIMRRLVIVCLLSLVSSTTLLAQRDSVSKTEFGVDQGIAVAFDNARGARSEFPVTLRFGYVSGRRRRTSELRLGFLERRQHEGAGSGVSVGYYSLLRLGSAMARATSATGHYVSVGVSAVRAEGSTVPAINGGYGVRRRVGAGAIRAEITVSAARGSTSSRDVIGLPSRSMIATRVGYSWLR